MELTDERLKKALAAGNIPVTEKALATLSEWVDRWGPVTFIMADRTGTSKSRTDLKKELSKLCKTLQSTVDILNRDDGQLAARLFEKVSGDQAPSVSVSLFSANSRLQLIEQQCDLLIRARASLKRLQAAKVRSGAPEHENTWFLELTRRLFGKLTGKPKPGIAGPLHRFTKAVAKLIGAEAGMVPESYETFKKRLQRQKGT